jgi:hypothetical protein
VTIFGSVEYLQSYVSSLGWADNPSHANHSVKGKEKVLEAECWSLYQELSTGSSRVKNGWVPPQDGWTKMNTDAECFPSTGSTSAGVIVHDNKGKVLLSAWRNLSNVASAEEAEALACLEGMRPMLEWVSRPTCVESDCVTLIKAIRSLDLSRARWLGIIAEIKELSRLLP